MKVGILTYHWVSNMGANLQALSTYSYLRNNGYEPIIINWVPKDVEQFYKEKVLLEQINAHKKFVQDNFRGITELCRTSEDVARIITRNDIHFICIGSDAVFSTKPYLSRWHFGRKGLKYIAPYSDATIYSPYWGDFRQYLPADYPIKIVGLSVSAQNTPYKKILLKNEKNLYLQALRRFSKLTVRDIWTKRLCEHVSQKSISPEITPDPVFGFNFNVKPKNLNFVRNQLNINGDYVLLSITDCSVDNYWIRSLERLFAEKGIIVVGFPKTISSIQNVLKHNLTFPISPLEWYDAIKNSKGYIGELMHPILVALHNSIPVFSFDTYGFKNLFKFDTKSSKVYQILKDFDLLDAYYNPKYNQLPEPQYILDRMLSMDLAKIRSHADFYLMKYKNMMEYLLD